MKVDLVHIDVDSYPFYKFVNEDKGRYKHAKDCGYVDPDDSFLIGDSGGFLMNIHPDAKFADIEQFTAVGKFYNEHKYYLPNNISSLREREFRKREEYRRRHGIDVKCMKIGNTYKEIHIPGSLYNLVNYGNMKMLDDREIVSTSVVKKAKKDMFIADFIDAQYWTIKSFEFAENNGLHMIVDKTRRGGFSYINAFDSANEINLDPSAVVIHVAIDKKYLIQKGGLTDFAIAQINFYENNTPFKRGVASKVSENFKMGIMQKDGRPHPDSWQSALISVSAHNDPNCAIGKDGTKIKVEELSTMLNFNQFMTVTEPAMRTGSYTTGMLTCWGTATDGDMQTFETNFYNPNSFHFMPFENVWDKDKRHTVCGLFKPYCWGLQGEIEGMKAMDDNGNSNIPVAIRIAVAERQAYKEHNTFDKFINYLGQYALYPAESFSNAKENVFIKPPLLDWERELATNPNYLFYSDGLFTDNKKKGLQFINNDVAEKSNMMFNREWFHYIENVPRQSGEDPHGCLRVFFHPYTEEIVEDGKVVNKAPEGMYSVYYDPVGVNKAKDDITNKHSHNCIHVWENPCKYNGFTTKMAACFYGRPDTLEEADKMFYHLCVYYNAIGAGLVEVDRGETVSNMKTWKATKYLKRNPKFLWNDNEKDLGEGEYGIVIGTAKIKLDAIRLTVEMLYEKVSEDASGDDVYILNKIFDLQTITELKKWNMLGNFDRVSTLLLRGIDWKAMDVKAERQLANADELDEDGNVIEDFFNRNWY